MKIRVVKKKNPILKNSLSRFNFWRWDSLWAYHPSVVEFKGRYYLFYTGKRIGRGIKHQIGLAVSSNLKRWEKLPQNPVLKEGKEGGWDDDFVAHAFVFQEGKKFYMLYDGSKTGSWLEEIGLAESEDLLHWRKYKNNPIFRVGESWWERRHVSRCCLFKEKGTYYLFYAGHSGRRERIGVAKGKSIFNLKRFLKEPVLDIGKKGEWDEESVSDPRIIKYKGIYLMFYSGLDKKGEERTGLAISQNLVNWRKYQGNPILKTSSNSWNKISATRVDVKAFKGKFYLFYSGKKAFFYQIGMAKLEIEL